MVKLKRRNTKKNSVEAYQCACMYTAYSLCGCICLCDCMHEYTSMSASNGGSSKEGASERARLNYSSNTLYVET